MIKKLFNFMNLSALMAMTMMLPSAAWAVTASELADGLENDPSVLLLAYIFGDVGGLFGGAAPASPLGAMFGVFNAGVLAVGGILVGYTILSGTLKTAHEGEALGRAWSSVWIPLRTALGMAMVLPGPGGYALVQVFIMFCAITGAGLANSVWNAFVDATGPGQYSPSVITDARKIMSNALISTACQTSRDYEMKLAKAGLDAEFSIADTTGPAISQIDSGTLVDWGNCGSMVLPKMDTGYPAIDSLYTLKTSELIAAEPGLRQIAVNSIATDDISAGRKGIQDLIKEYDATITAAAKGAYTQATEEDSFQQIIKAQGWILAGATWIKSSERLKKLTSAAADSKVTYSAPSYESMGPESAAAAKSLATMFGVSNTYMAAMEARKTGQMTADMSMDDRLKRVANTVDMARSGPSLEDMSSNPEAIVAGFLSPIAGVITAFLMLDPGSDILTGVAMKFSSEQDPFMTLVALGNAVSTTATTLFFVVGAAIVAIGLLTVAGTGGAGGAAPFAAWFGPAFLIVATAIVVFGFSLSVYLPLLPTITWLMAVAGWVVLVIESMVAAPIWAIMHASPEGHEWSGKGAQGYMIVLGLILRPALMIFGLVGAMMAMKAFVVLASIAFSFAVTSLDESSGAAGIMGPLAVIVLFCLYVWLILWLVHRAIQVISEVPSSIMKWVGGGVDSLGSDPHPEGKSFMQGVMGRGESAMQAGMAAKKGLNTRGHAAGAQEEMKDAMSTSKELDGQLVPKSIAPDIKES